MMTRRQVERPILLEVAGDTASKCEAKYGYIMLYRLTYTGIQWILSYFMVVHFLSMIHPVEFLSYDSRFADGHLRVRDSVCVQPHPSSWDPVGSGFNPQGCLKHPSSTETTSRDDDHPQYIGWYNPLWSSTRLFRKFEHPSQSWSWSNPIDKAVLRTARSVHVVQRPATAKATLGAWSRLLPRKVRYELQMLTTPTTKEPTRQTRPNQTDLKRNMDLRYLSAVSLFTLSDRFLDSLIHWMDERIEHTTTTVLYYIIL